MSAITYPLLTVMDDNGLIVTGATVTIASLKDMNDADVSQDNVSILKSGANVAVRYDATVKGESWITLNIVKSGSPITGRNQTPSFFLAEDSSWLKGISAASATPTIKGRIVAAQLVASGATTDLDVSESRRQTLYLRHSNGSGTVTTPALISVQVKPSDGTYVESQAITASKVDGASNSMLVELPDDCATVKVVYTAPVGPTGATLDLEIGTLTTS